MAAVRLPPQSLIVTLGFVDSPMECTVSLSLVRLVTSSGCGATLYFPSGLILELEESCLEASKPSGPPGYRAGGFQVFLLRSDSVGFVHGPLGLGSLGIGG